MVTNGGTSSSGATGPTGTSSGISDGGVTWDYSVAASANNAASLALFALIDPAVGKYLLSTGIGGLEQVAGAGVVYTSDIQDAVRDAAAGLYAAAVSLPGTTTIAVLLGHIKVPGTVTGVLTVV